MPFVLTDDNYNYISIYFCKYNVTTALLIAFIAAHASKCAIIYSMSKSIDELTQISWRTRARVLRMIRAAGSGHLASSLGSSDIFTYFYHNVLNLHPGPTVFAERDYFLLSAGHLCPAWYATLSECGFFAPEHLLTLRQFGSPLQGHPHRQVELGIENIAGPLGQGLSMAAGLALARQRAGSQQKVFVLSSDGEQQEGQVWEAYLFAAHYRLANLLVIIDVNRIQQSGLVRQVMNLGDLAAKLQSFGFAVCECDGHDFADLAAKYSELASVSDKPQCLLCRTVPGKGISLLEGDALWHAAQPTDQQWGEIFAELADKLTAAGVDLKELI